MRKLSIREVMAYTGLIIAMAYVFFYLKLVDISLIYYWQQTVPLSFAEYLGYPGGFSNLLAIKFNELLTNPFRGAIAVVTLLSIIYFLLRNVFNYYNKSSFFHPVLLAAIVPAVLLFAIYRLPVGLTVGFLIGLIFAFIYSLYTPGKLLIKLVYIFITGFITYLLAGPVGLVVLLQVCIVKTILSGKNSEILAVVPLLLVIPLLYLLFNEAITIKQVYLGSLITSKYDFVPLLYVVNLFIPSLLMILFPLINRMFSGAGESRNTIFEGIGTGLVVTGLIFSSLSVIDREERSIYQIEQASFDDDWQQVLELGDEELYHNKLVQFEINRALYHDGVLLEKAFRYPQLSGEAGIFLEQTFSGRHGIHVSDFYADLGYANESRHWANESHMIIMRHPIILKQLILSYIAIGKQDIAVKYLGVLSGSNIHKEWCDMILESLSGNDPEGIPYLQTFTDNNPKNDFFASPSNPIQKLEYFYTVNPENRMAFEFLMTSYLLKHQVGPVISHISDLKRFGYSSLPRVIQEAVMIYLHNTKSRSMDLSGYKISQETVNEFQDFIQLMANSNNRSEAMKRLSKYKQTYWYYIMYSSPYANKNQ